MLNIIKFLSQKQQIEVIKVFYSKGNQLKQQRLHSKGDHKSYVVETIRILW